MSGPAAYPRGPLTAESLPILREEYLAAVLSGDPTRARSLIAHAVDRGTAVADVYLGVLEPALARVGELWADGELNVAYEHYATAITESVLGELGWQIRVPATSGRLAVVACTPGEQHCVGGQMISHFVEAEGWEAFWLGASTPPADMVALVDAERPDVVALSTTTPDRMPAAIELLRALARLETPPLMVVGGQAWREVAPERVAEFGADLRIDGAPALLEVLRERFPPVGDD